MDIEIKFNTIGRVNALPIFLCTIFRKMTLFNSSAVWYYKNMSEILKTIAGFTAIILVGLAGVTISHMMKLGEMNALIMTVDNISHTR